MKPRIEVQLASRVRGLPNAAQLRRWAVAALGEDVAAELTLRVVNAAEGRVLNREYRGRDYATNVLTFAYGGEPLCADIVLCAQVVAREAREQGKPLAAHYAHLTVHGVLHAQGHDHEKPAEAKRMERREIEILRALGLPDPYI
jgi:probable rRNA maturation factor